MLLRPYLKPGHIATLFLQKQVANYKTGNHFFTPDSKDFSEKLEVKNN
jgi:hypothetical protein